MDKTKHTRTSFVKQENLLKHTKNPLLKDSQPLNRNVYEVEKGRKTVVHDLPIQIGLAVYSYAKLRMLEFWEFLNTYLDNNLYQLLQMDTDSLYAAFARDTIDECVKPEKRVEWETVKWEWFTSEDRETMVELDDQEITKAQWDKRTPGKFKTEFAGTGMACLNSKVYICWGGFDKDGKPYMKISCKGVQQKRNELLRRHYLNVLLTQEPHFVTNAGFIRDGNGDTKTYTLRKKGLTYFYVKRKVLADGVSTTHLDI